MPGVAVDGSSVEQLLCFYILQQTSLNVDVPACVALAPDQPGCCGNVPLPVLG
jgi:hypothetical protein